MVILCTCIVQVYISNKDIKMDIIMYINLRWDIILRWDIMFVVGVGSK